METLKSKVILVVDATSEVGEATCKVFARYSATLCLCATNEQGLEKLAMDCKKAGLDDKQISTLYVSDLNNKQQMWAVVEKVIEKHGQLHALIYLCDEQCSRSFEETSLADLNAMHTVHVESPLLWLQQSLPHLKKTKGSVVALTSGYTRKSVPGMFAYVLSKAAEDHLIRTMALDVASYGVRVNAVSQLRPSNTDKESSKESTNVLSTMSEYIAYLTCDAASFITGQCVSIGQGFTADFSATSS